MLDTLDSALDLVSGNGSGRYYMGKVLDNVDPLGLDRIKASVSGLYDTDYGEIPWIAPIKISPFGIGAAWGVYGSPAIDSDVLILLQDGDGHYPLYMSVQINDSSADFPSGESWGFTDPWANKLQVKSDQTIHFESGSGVSVDISETGKLTITTPDDAALHTTGNVTVTATGNIDVSADGNVSVSAQGTMDLTAQGNMTAVTQGNLVATATGNATITAAQNTINGPTTINGNTSIVGTLHNNGVDVGSTHKHMVVSVGIDTLVPGT